MGDQNHHVPCDGCKKEGMDLELVERLGEMRHLCKKCRRKPWCPKCKKIKNRLILVPNSSNQVCGPCLKKLGW